MNALLQLALNNAVAATALAIVAAAAAAVFRRPPLTRALWVVVLLKLITPPLWHVDLPRLARTPAPDDTAPVRMQTLAIEPTDERPRPEIIAEQPPAGVIEPVAAPSPAVQRPAAWRRLVPLWPWALAALWAGGTVLQFLRVAQSVRRLRSLARRGLPVDPHTLARMRHLAGRLGLRRCPQVSFIHGTISPMLCAVGMSPRLLLPAALWERLDDRQRDTVLTHELAHLRRGDHWVRALEVFVAALYWWHPVVWWAHRTLREATEQCCDAWVLWALPRSAASYATALIEAIDFISTAKPAVPLLASGMGQFTHLKRRLVMIKRGTAGKALSWPAFGAVCTLGGLLLPLAPGFGQTLAVTTSQQANALPEGATVAVAPGAGVPDGTPTAELSITTIETTPDAPATNNRGADNNDPKGVSEARREVERLRSQLARAEDRLARLEGRQPGRRTATAMRGQGWAVTRSDVTRNADENAAYNRIGDAARDNQQQRLDALENQVRQILGELRQMKREQRDRPKPDTNSQAR